MDLRESKFYSAGHSLNFTVFSDHPCRVKYLESIPVSIDQSSVSVYTIEPAATSEWVAVQETEEGNSRIRLFVRKGTAFPEDRKGRLPKELKKKLEQRIPGVRQNQQRSIAA